MQRRASKANLTSVAYAIEAKWNNGVYRKSSRCPFQCPPTHDLAAFSNEKGFSDFSLNPCFDGGAGRNRTDDLYNAIVALSQLSYSPVLDIPPMLGRRSYLRCGKLRFSGASIKQKSHRSKILARKNVPAMRFTPHPFARAHRLRRLRPGPRCPR